MQSKEEYIKKFFLMSPEYQPDGRQSIIAANEYIRKAFASGGAKFKWTHMTASGEPFPAEITLIRVPKGEGYILVGYINDLRDQEAALHKQNEAREIAERYAKARNEFLASVSHEIRTPLNAILSMARIADSIGDINENQKNIIKQGMLSVKLLTSAIETILDFSKLDSGQLSLETVTFSVRKLIEGIAEMVRKDAAEKGLYLHITIDPEVPELVLGDSIRLQQAIFNIVINAVKFTESGGVTIHVKREEDSGDARVSLVFEVQDTGIGISEDKMDDLFKPLVSGDSSYTRKYSGMGMGLAISSGLAALMDGKITFESSLGKGSTFRFFISLALPQEKAAIKGQTQLTYNTEALKGMRVLVAEDNSINQMVIEEVLSSAGIEVTLAGNGLIALEKLREGSFDLVLMDIQMPEMDGLTASVQIRADPRYAKLPVLAMTANAGEEHLAESKNAGMNDHLTKPVEAETLFNALIKWGRGGQEYNHKI